MIPQAVGTSIHFTDQIYSKINQIDKYVYRYTRIRMRACTKLHHSNCHLSCSSMSLFRNSEHIFYYLTSLRLLFFSCSSCYARCKVYCSPISLHSHQVVSPFRCERVHVRREARKQADKYEYYSSSSSSSSASLSVILALALFCNHVRHSGRLLRWIFLTNSYDTPANEERKKHTIENDGEQNYFTHVCTHRTQVICQYFAEASRRRRRTRGAECAPQTWERQYAAIEAKKSAFKFAERRRETHKRLCIELNFIAHFISLGAQFSARISEQKLCTYFKAAAAEAICLCLHNIINCFRFFLYWRKRKSFKTFNTRACARWKSESCTLALRR